MNRAIVFAAALGMTVAGAPLAAQQPVKPKLIVALSMDQFSANLFAEYREHFTGGLRRLSGGAVFPAGYQSHAATETCPGHSTILTGSRPARTGIIANDWFDQTIAREDKHVYCAEDESVPGSNSDDYTASVIHLKVPTLGGRMKAANPASRVVSVAGKDRAALMMGGPVTDQIWWWGGKAYVGPANQTARPVVAKVNAEVAAEIAKSREAMQLPSFCEARSRPVQVGDMQVGDGRFARDGGDIAHFRASPAFDQATLSLATALIDDMKLGRGEAPDVISIGLSATDYVGHTLGTEGSEMCLQLATVDKAIGVLFAHLDAEGIDYVAVLTSDHGGQDTPERLRAQGMTDAQRVDAALSPDALGKTIGATLGLSGPVLLGGGPSGDFYIDRALTPEQRNAVLTEATRLLSTNAQVAAVIPAATLMAMPMPSGSVDEWTLEQRARASFYPGRSGDFIVALKPRVTPIAKPKAGSSIATHGSFWDYDRRVPILFWRKGMTNFEQPMPVETVDILPTLAGLIDLSVPASEIDGRCLDLDAGPASTCPVQ